jgi:hypothetical protein
MAINFENILEHTIQLSDFELDWRFTDERYDKIPGQHLALLQPLDKKASKFLWDYINLVGLHNDIPFKKVFFTPLIRLKFYLIISVTSRNGFIDEQFPLMSLSSLAGSRILQ